MSRAPKSDYDLTDAEKRDLIQLIQQGKNLPEKYRFVLFEDKREVELVWNGKTREVCTTILPFQSLEHIDEPRREAPEIQGDLFDSRGRQLKGWTNKLIWGDNKLILSSLKSGALRQQIEEAGGLKLIYIDPPFDVGADFSMDVEIGGETFHKEPNLLEQIAYRDTWGRGADSFISMIYERLILMRDLLAEDGSIYVHCDWRVNSFIRLALNEVFGSHCFVNEVIWQKCNTKNYTSRSLSNVHDTILFYTKTRNYRFNEVYDELSAEYVGSAYRHSDDKGKRYRLLPLHAPGRRSGKTGGEWKGMRPLEGNHWRFHPDTLDEMDSKGLIEISRTGVPAYRKYLDDSEGVRIGTIWLDAKQLPNSEKVNYPTQKPTTILEKIIRIGSNEGDLVADFFCGSGTTAAVAEKLGRKWICTDLGKFAIHTTRKRLIQVQRERKDKDESFRAFEVLNLGRYERQAYLGVNFTLGRHSRENGNPERDKLDASLREHDGVVLTREEKQRRVLAQKEREFRDLILRAYKATPLTGASAQTQDEFFHGHQSGRLVVIGPINLPVGRLFVEEVITECRKRGASRVDVLAFEFEMGLFPAVLDEARHKGIDLAPKYIPAEVFDKRAVDKGHVVFHDVSFIEATPRYDDKEKLTLRIELTDFSVYYTQGAVEAAIASLKNGKSEVVCEQGRLMKVSKDKDGIVTREVLTKHWTDWVDDWAVDFDYMSRKEIIKVPKSMGLGVVQAPPPQPSPASGGGSCMIEFEERWTGSYIFENEWQAFRTRRNRDLELVSAAHVYSKAGRYTVAVKVIDIFGNDTMTLAPVNVG